MTANSFASAAPVGTDWHKQEREPVLIHFDDHQSLDSLEDQAKEAFKEPGGLTRLVNRMVEEQIRAERSDYVAAVLCEVIQSANPLRALVEIAFACGATATADWTMTSMAERFGVSKEAIQQGVDNQQEKFGFRQTRYMRDEESCELMSLTNYRRSAAS